MMFSKQKYFFLTILTISLMFYGTVINSAYADNHPTAAIAYSETGPYKSGDEITFVEDASRLWDKKAIAVYFKGYKLGYLSNGIRAMMKRAFLNKSYSRGIIQFNSKTKVSCFNAVDLFIEIH